MFSHNMLFLVYIADYLTADASWECEQELNDGFFPCVQADWKQLLGVLVIASLAGAKYMI
jgi:hypothetical protein